MARNLTDAFDGMLRAPVRYVLLDRDTKFTAEFQALLKAADVEPVLLPPKSPNCNAFLERFFRRAASKKKPCRSTFYLVFSESIKRCYKTTTRSFCALYYHVGAALIKGLDHHHLPTRQDRR